MVSVLLSDSYHEKWYLNFKGGPFRGSPVECFTRVDDMGESPDNFLHGSRLIRSMSHDNINIVQLQPFQRIIHSLQQMFPTQPNLVWRITLTLIQENQRTYSAPEKFSGDDKIFSFPFKCFNCFSHGNFTFSVSVDFCAIEKVDSVFPGFVHTFQSEFFTDLAAVGDPSS
jgi:hypothetical protein